MTEAKTHVLEGLLAKLHRCFPLDRDTVAAVRAWPAVTHNLPRKGFFSRQTGCRILISGIVARYVSGIQGGRIVLSLHLPGDILDLPELFGARQKTDLLAVSGIEFATVQPQTMLAAARDRPALDRALWGLSLLDAAIGQRWLFNVGHRDAKTRLAHLFCELRHRLATVGLADERSFALPLSQDLLGSALGLTAVHVNRTLRVLEGDGLISYAASRIVIHDLDGLQHVGGFDPGYLNAGLTR